jgi:hypothetical protein
VLEILNLFGACIFFLAHSFRVHLVAAIVPGPLSLRPIRPLPHAILVEGRRRRSNPGGAKIARPRPVTRRSGLCVARRHHLSPSLPLILEGQRGKLPCGPKPYLLAAFTIVGSSGCALPSSLVLDVRGCERGVGATRWVARGWGVILRSSKTTKNPP